MNADLKCKKCRTLLVNTNQLPLLNQHGHILDFINHTVTYDCGGNFIDAWYFQDDKLPGWISDEIDKTGWQKGKLRCPQCKVTIGSFDFISGTKCSCSRTLKPCIHFIKSKLDVNSKQFE